MRNNQYIPVFIELDLTTGSYRKLVERDVHIEDLIYEKIVEVTPSFSPVSVRIKLLVYRPHKQEDHYNIGEVG